MEQLLVADLVDNPYFGPTSPEEHRQIPVVRTLRGDPIAAMFAKHQIDAAQYRAARDWQRLNEMAGPHMKSPGDIQEPVDGGGHIRDGLLPAQVDASRRLKEIRLLLGPRQHQLLVLVLESGLSAWGATAAMFPNDLSHNRHRFVSTWLKEILSILARDMELAS